MKQRKRKSGRSEAVEEAVRLKASRTEPGGKLGSEVAIAAECGVSRMTARKAVNALIAEGIVERRAGIGIFVRGGDSFTRRFRFIAGNLLWEAAVRMASAARRTVAGRGAELELRDAHGSEDAYLSEIESLPASGCDGAIVVSIHESRADAAIRRLAATGFPLVVIDETFDDGSVAGVASDNTAGGALAAGALVEAGHTALGFLGDVDTGTVRARLDGFRSVLLGRGLKEPSVYRLHDLDRLGSWETGVRTLAKRIAGLKKRPTGILCSCDTVARFAMRTFAECGLSVPGDVSLIGFDDDPIAEWTAPALTTVHQDFDGLGVAAAERLASFRSMDDPYERMTVPVSLVSRQSVGRPPAAKS